MTTGMRILDGEATLVRNSDGSLVELEDLGGGNTDTSQFYTKGEFDIRLAFEQHLQCLEEPIEGVEPGNRWAAPHAVPTESEHDRGKTQAAETVVDYPHGEVGHRAYAFPRPHYEDV